MTNIIFDEDELAQTARVVALINPHCFSTVDELVFQMKMDAKKSFTSGSGYISIFGYVLTAFNHPDSGFDCPIGTIGVKSSVSAYTVEKFLKSA